MGLMLSFLLMMAAPGAIGGTLCFEGSDCTETHGTIIEVQPPETATRYVWTSGDGKTVVAGELVPETDRIDLGSASGRTTVRYSVRGDASRGWPSDVLFTVAKSDDALWTWKVPASLTRKEVTLRVPTGEYRLWLEADRHQSSVRTIQGDGELELGEIRLEPLPRITGRVTTTGEENAVISVAAAEVTLPDGSAAARSDEQGAFELELEEPFPEELWVSSPGLGTHIVPLGRLEPENDLGEIRLDAGVILHLDVNRPADSRGDSMNVRLLKEGNRYEHTQLRTADLKPEADSMEFTDLSAGDYIVVFEGEGDLERLAVPVEVGTTDLARTIEIRPYLLDGTVALGDKPLGDATVVLKPDALGPTWEATLHTDPEGRFSGMLWQPGHLHAWVSPPSETIGGIMYATSPEMGNDPSRWSLQFKNRTIHGRVLDAETGAVVANARIRLEIETANGRAYSPVLINESGEYEIVAWQNGTYDLAVTSPDYLPWKSTVVLTDTDDSRNLDFPLDRGSGVTLEFVWSSGQPVAGAPVLEGIARDGHNAEQYHKTDGAGHLTLRVAEGQARVLYILPGEGSFAVARVRDTGSEDTNVRIEVPPPAGTLHLTLRDEDGKGADGIVMLRYNGEWIPYPVSARMHGARTAKGKREIHDLPAGVWEVWGLAPPSTPATIPNVPPTDPPVRVGVSSGVTEAEVTLVPFD